MEPSISENQVLYWCFCDCDDF